MTSERVVRIGNIEFSDREKKAIMAVCDSNRVTEHKKTAEFERAWAEKIGTKYSVAVNSGTSGLVLGLTALKYMSDDPRRKKVITAPLTFIATSNAVKIAGLEPVFGDIDKRTFALKPSEIERILSEQNPKEFLGVLPVHLMGYPCDMDKIIQIAQENNLFTFEDAAQAHGTVYKNKGKLGSFGDISNFSFYVAHNVQVGELGAVNTSNSNIKNLLKSLKAHGRVCTCDICRRMEGNCPEMKKYEGDEEDYDPRYTHNRIGFNFKTNEFMTAIALERLKGMEETNLKRQENVKYFNKGLKKHSDVLQLPEYSPSVSYLGYPIVIKKGSRKKLREELEKRGIETRILFGCIPTQQPSFNYLKKNYTREKTLQNAEYVGRNGFFIGCHQDLTTEDLEHVVDSFNEILS